MTTFQNLWVTKYFKLLRNEDFKLKSSVVFQSALQVFTFINISALSMKGGGTFSKNWKWLGVSETTVDGKDHRIHSLKWLKREMKEFNLWP